MSKYGSKQSGGYASQGERRRAQELQLLQKCGAISNLEEQVTIEIIPKFAIGPVKYRAICYRADFRYQENGVVVVEDFKGFETDVYKLKRKLLAFHKGIVIRETR